MNHHHQLGEAIARSALGSPDLLEIMKHYPTPFACGKGFEEIEHCQPMVAVICRIVAVCDAFDSMTNDKPYRNARSEEEAIRELNANAPSQFDPSVIAVLERVLQVDSEARLPLLVKDADLRSIPRLSNPDVAAAVMMGDTGPLRSVMRKLKRNSLNESVQVQDAVQELEQSLDKNDDQFNELIASILEMVDLCQKSGEVNPITPWPSPPTVH